VRDRLNHLSTIVFVQNGMGVVDEVNEKVFPDAHSRPHYIIGVMSHGIRNSCLRDLDSAPPVLLPSPTPIATTTLPVRRHFSIIHTGPGTLELGMLPQNDRDSTLSIAPTARYLLRTLTRAPELCATGHAPDDPSDSILLFQLEKLAINAVINPLTALLDVPNGGILHNPPLSQSISGILSEISQLVLRLPEVSHIDTDLLRDRFSVDRLTTLALGVAERTAANSSSMREDVHQYRFTESAYINGYVARRGRELDLPCPRNEMVADLVDAAAELKRKERYSWVPMLPGLADPEADEQQRREINKL
jgi:2-dehydropantoate 2-reductase